MNIVCKTYGHDFAMRKQSPRACVRCGHMERVSARYDAAAYRDSLTFNSRHDAAPSDPKAIV